MRQAHVIFFFLPNKKQYFFLENNPAPRPTPSPEYQMVGP